MRNAFWTPRKERERREERPYLQVPSPMDNRPWRRPEETEREQGDEEDSPRVIIIDI